ncbi:phosphatase [Piscirickettsia salmonis]|uniref:phosphatase n=1 Tax=Piscirickettsia salmonis TaxID=1238 RepID=UPI0012D2A721|nr:phosphatase [Piscirickettsia salmonis]
MLSWLDSLTLKGIRVSSFFLIRKRRYLGRYFAHPMMQNRRAKRDDYKPSAVRVTQRCVP